MELHLAELKDKKADEMRKEVYMAKIKEIWCMHHSHLDIGYTHPQPMLMKLQEDYIDQAIEMCEKTENYPEESRFRWTCEATYPVIQWFDSASEQMKEKFIKLVAENRISVAALPMHTTPGCTGEQLSKALRELADLRNVLQNPVSTAINHDVNGQPWSLTQVLLDSNVNFYMTGINIHFGGIPFQRPCAFWWKAPDQRKILSYVGEHYSLFSQFFMTDQADTTRMHEGICNYVKRLERQNHKWNFAFLTATNPPMYDNNCPDAGLADLIRKYNEEGHEYKVRFATPEMLRDKLLSMGEEMFPVWEGDWTDYWNFGSSSTARETKVNRLAVRALESTDVLECMTDFRSDRYKAAKKEAELNALMYEEHTWGASQSVSDPQDYESISQLIHKQEMAYRAADLAGYVLGTQMEKIAKNPFQTDLLEGITVLNPTSITQEIPLKVPTGWMRKERQIGSVRIKRYIPYLQNEQPKAYYANEEKEYFGKISVPPYSVKVLTFEEVRNNSKVTENGWLVTMMNGIETPFYRIEFYEEDGIKQIYSKKFERNLFKEDGEWRIFEAVRETIDDTNQEKNRRTIFPRDVDLCNQNISMWNHDWKAKRTGSSLKTKWKVEIASEKLLLYGTLTMDGTCQASQMICFYKDTPSIDFEFKVNKEAVYEPEAFYLIFPLLLQEGWGCVYNTAGQFVKLDEEQLGNSCRDYITVENGIALYDDEICYSLSCPDAPLVQVGNFNFGRENRKIERRKDPFIVAWPLNNYWDTNFAASQRDTMEFRYRMNVFECLDYDLLYRDFVETEDRGLIGAVADMKSLVSTENEKEQHLIICSREGMISGIYPAQNGGMIVSLRNHQKGTETISMEFPNWGEICAWEVDVQEQPIKELTTLDGKLEVILEGCAWKRVLIKEKEEKGDGDE